TDELRDHETAVEDRLVLHVRRWSERDPAAPLAGEACGGRRRSREERNDAVANPVAAVDGVVSPGERPERPLARGRALAVLGRLDAGRRVVVEARRVLRLAAPPAVPPA